MHLYLLRRMQIRRRTSLRTRKSKNFSSLVAIKMHKALLNCLSAGPMGVIHINSYKVIGDENDIDDGISTDDEDYLGVSTPK
jgi:hypothetical protein